MNLIAYNFTSALFTGFMFFLIKEESKWKALFMSILSCINLYCGIYNLLKVVPHG
jgi:hypothetical protein